MNKIKVIDNKIDTKIDSNIKVDISNDETNLNVVKIIIKPLLDTSLEIEYKSNEFKANIEINIDENINFNLFELRYDKNVKVKYDYNINNYATLNVTKFYDSNNVFESDTVNLNGEYASVNYILKTVSTDKQVYDLNINHNNTNTISNVVNSGVNIDGTIDFNIKGKVKKGNTNSELNQNNRIITFNDKICKINPILLIDENDVIANHSALIGKFDDEELFYLESRGINYEKAIKLLIKGFLLEGTNDERIEKIIEKYWR